MSKRFKSSSKILVDPLIHLVFGFLNIQDRCEKCVLVCKSWHNANKKPESWTGSTLITLSSLPSQSFAEKFRFHVHITPEKSPSVEFKTLADVYGTAWRQCTRQKVYISNAIDFQLFLQGRAPWPKPRALLSLEILLTFPGRFVHPTDRIPIEITPLPDDNILHHLRELRLFNVSSQLPSVGLDLSALNNLTTFSCVNVNTPALISCPSTLTYMDIGSFDNNNVPSRFLAIDDYLSLFNSSHVSIDRCRKRLKTIHLIGCPYIISPVDKLDGVREDDEYISNRRKLIYSGLNDRSKPIFENVSHAEMTLCGHGDCKEPSKLMSYLATLFRSSLRSFRWNEQYRIADPFFSNCRLFKCLIILEIHTHLNDDSCKFANKLCSPSFSMFLPELRVIIGDHTWLHSTSNSSTTTRPVLTTITKYVPKSQPDTSTNITEMIIYHPIVLGGADNRTLHLCESDVRNQTLSHGRKRISVISNINRILNSRPGITVVVLTKYREAFSPSLEWSLEEFPRTQWFTNEMNTSDVPGTSWFDDAKCFQDRCICRRKK